MSSKTTPIDIKRPARSRSSSTMRTRQSLQGLSLGLDSQPPNRRTRSRLASAIGSDEEDELNIKDVSTSSIKLASKANNGVMKSASRVSMSSISTANDYASSSGYSTPGTSAVATPLTVAKEEHGNAAPRSRGRPRKAAPLAPAALEALDRAKALRNSEYSLQPQNNKRKRYSMDDEDEDGDDDADNSLDAQLARTLQEEEDRLATDNMMMEDEASDFTPRRSRAQRALRPILPKADYVVDLSDEEVETIQVKPTPQNKKGATSKVPASRTKKVKTSFSDSDESDFVMSGDEDVEVASRSSSEIPLAATSSARRQAQAQTNTAPSALPAGRFDRRGGSRIRAAADSVLQSLPSDSGEDDHDLDRLLYFNGDSESESDDLDADSTAGARPIRRAMRRGISWQEAKANRRAALDRSRLETHHPELLTMWDDLKNLPKIKSMKAEQPTNISRELKPFQLEGLSWMQAMEKTEWGGGLLGDEMGMGKTIQAVSLIMSDYPAKSPSLVLIPPVALMQWQQEIGDYTDGTLKTFVFHGTNKDTKGIKVAALKKYDVILMSYNSLEAMFRRQEKGVKRDDVLHKQDSVIHKIHFHRVILDEAHNIKTRTTGVAKACFALKADHKWCLSGTPLQNRIGEFFSLVRFLDIRPFACYFCKQCPCSTLEWSMNADNRCTGCSHSGMQHVSVFNQELLNPIQKHGNKGPGKEAFAKLRLLTDRFMLRRVKRDHSSAMELPAKEIHVDRQFFSEVENDFAGSIMNNNQRKFDTYVANGVLLNNYANIFGLIMQMRQVADHPDLILKKHGEGGQNILVCCICDDPAEDAIRSSCRHEFCRGCAKNFILSAEDTNAQPDCPQCHIPLSIDLEQPEIEQDEQQVKKSSIINRIKMEKWTSSTKIEMLVYKLHSLRSEKSSTKSIIFSQFTTMLQLVEWRLRRAGITTVMLDGSMTPAQRQGSINHFMQNVDCECFLVSLKAGGVALNLTEASHVFIVDPWWNPAAEWQSADRCHRIGQSRPCSITRLCIEDSVESRMVLLQEKKANMINSTINSDDAAMESLTPEDMQFLFRGN